MSDEEDEDPVDPKGPLTEECMKTRACAKLLVSCARTRFSYVFALVHSQQSDAPRTHLQVEYEKCAERIEAKGHGNCAGQYMDYIACADQCAKDAIFKALK